MSDADVDTIRVVHVDDDPEIVDLAATFLEREDDRLSVEPAETAEGALQRLEDEEIHCIISDYQLPDMDCPEFVAATREQSSDLPFLLFTGRDRSQLDEDLLASSVTAYLQKGSGTEQYSRLASEILGAVDDDVVTDGGWPPTDDDADEDSPSMVENPDIGGIEHANTEAILSGALDAVEDGFFIIDGNRNFVYWNQYISTATGYDDEEISEMDPIEFFVSEDRERIDDAIESAADTGRAVVEARVKPKQGPPIPTEFRGTRLHDDDGEILGIAGIARDISDRAAYERELERQNERLEELISAISHDLRNPLNVITGRVQLAREMDGEEHFDALERATEEMEQLLEELVELARKGHTVDETEPVELAGVADRAWSSIDPADATLSVETDRTVQANEKLLQELVATLFDNSVTHGGDGVSVTLGALDDGFYVEDDGPGIPADRRERMQEYGETTDHESTGQGLALARRIAEAHGWSLSITDGTAGGARLEFTGVDGELPPSK